MKETIKKFKELKMNTVEGAIERFVKERDYMLELAKKDAIRSVAYYTALERMTNDFIDKVSKRRFPILNDELWGYEVFFDQTSVCLELTKFDYAPFGEGDETEYRFYETEHMPLFRVEPKLLSISEYAAQYAVDDRTVTQWIRRGKIRNAKKIGNSWMIPEITDTPTRGYTSASYYLDVDVRPLSDEYPFLVGIEHVMIQQDDDDKNKYIISCYKSDSSEGVIYRPVHVEEWTIKEKEKFELGLISHPSVRYSPDWTETVLLDVIRNSQHDSEE